MERETMTEGKWEPAKHSDIKEGDTVRVRRKAGPQTIVTEGKVTSRRVLSSGETIWEVENYENFYRYEFVENEDGVVSTLERLKPAFVWPTKLGAIVTGRGEDETVTAVLVYLATSSAEENVWWTIQWGVLATDNLEHLEDLTVVSEGVTVEA